MVRVDEGRWAGPALSLLRIVAGLLFLLHGTSKLIGFPPFAGGPLPDPWTLLWIGAILELVGGFLVMIGLFTRPAAFILSGEMAVAYWMFHAPQSTFPSNNGGEAAVLFCFVFLMFAFNGAGPWSVDANRGRKVVVTENGA